MADQFTNLSPDVTSDDKLWAALTYALAPIVPVIILLMEDKKNRPFIKAHNIQALIWSLAVIVISGVLTAVVIGPCIGLAGWIVSLYWAYQAYQGKMFGIPVVATVRP